jgi:hypothetical protein
MGVVVRAGVAPRVVTVRAARGRATRRTGQVKILHKHVSAMPALHSCESREEAGEAKKETVNERERASEGRGCRRGFADAAR